MSLHAATHAPAGPVATVPGEAGGALAASKGSPSRVARALGRVEGRRLTWAMPAPLAVTVFALGRSERVVDLRQSSIDAPFLLLLAAAVTLVVSNRAVLRERRHGTAEMYSAVPTSATTRTAAHLLAIAGPVVMASVAVAAMAVADLSKANLGSVQWLELAVGPLLVAGAGCLGVLVARWAPFPLVAVVTCVAIAAFEMILNGGRFVVSGVRWLAFWAESGDLLLRPPRPAAWHLLYLVGLIGLAAAAALLRHGWRRGVVVGASVAAVAVVVSAVAQLVPPGHEAWAERELVLSDPASVQVCEEHGGLRYCAFEEERELIRYWPPVVEGVRRAVPPGQWPAGMAVTQRVAPVDVQYAYEAMERVLPSLLPSEERALDDDGDIHPGLGWTFGVGDLSVGLHAANLVVGLPPYWDRPDERCDASGQARGALALWLAAQATDRAGDTLLRLARDYKVTSAGGVLVAWPDLEHGGASVWGLNEVGLALDLLALPRETVLTAVAAGWDRFVDPATPTSALAQAVGAPIGGSAAWRASGPAREADFEVAGACGRRS